MAYAAVGIPLKFDHIEVERQEVEPIHFCAIWKWLENATPRQLTRRVQTWDMKGLHPGAEGLSLSTSILMVVSLRRN